MKPRIGITYTYRAGEDGRSNANVRAYVAAVEAAGGEPVLLRNDVSNVEETLSSLNGLILSGGTDVDPKHYGELPHPKTQPANEARDQFEIALARLARKRRVPTLCVCRGLQLANVAFGGTLIQDLPDEFGDERALKHHQINEEDGLERDDYLPGHEVRLEPESALARLLGTTRFASNSMHHQAVPEGGVSKELRVVGKTPDGVIEALDARFEHPFFHAVQWHPEELPDDPVSRALFGGLVEASRKTAVASAL